VSERLSPNTSPLAETAASDSTSVHNTSFGVRLRDFAQANAILPVALVIWLILALLNSTFATWPNIQTILAASAVVLTAAIGETLVLLTGDIDVSVATVATCSGVVAAAVMGREGDPAVGLLVALLVGAGFGLINGIACGVFGLTAFIFTLGTMLVARGIAFSISEGIAMRIPRAIRDFGRLDVIGIPAIAVVALVAVAVFAFILSQTTWGRQVYLLGSNAAAAHYVGIRRRLVRLSVFLVSGALGGLAGYLALANLGVAIPGLGDTILLTIIGGVIVGGTSLFGGEGSLWRTVVGVLLLAGLTNGLNLIGIPFYDQLIVQGVVILIGTALVARLARTTMER